VEQAMELPEPLKVGMSRLHLFPDASGMQHDEIESMRDSYPGWWPEKLRFVWAKLPREVHLEAPLHPTVLQRFAFANGVLHYALRRLYRPTNLAKHKVASVHYTSDSQTPAHSRLELLEQPTAKVSKPTSS
jgi:hypothetical protein